jgi:hypothetical protein
MNCDEAYTMLTLMGLRVYMTPVRVPTAESLHIKYGRRSYEASLVYTTGIGWTKVLSADLRGYLYVGRIALFNELLMELTPELLERMKED